MRRNSALLGIDSDDVFARPGAGHRRAGGGTRTQYHSATQGGREPDGRIDHGKGLCREGSDRRGARQLRLSEREREPDKAAEGMRMSRSTCGAAAFRWKKKTTW